jgi:hypothetical protein
MSPEIQSYFNCLSVTYDSKVSGLSYNSSLTDQIVSANNGVSDVTTRILW